MIPFLKNINSILVTGGSGFIGGSLVRRLLKETNSKIYNLDKISYASFLNNYNNYNNYKLINV